MLADTSRDVAEAAWRWVLAQVGGDGSPWIPESVPSQVPGPPEQRDGLHSGIGGLALALAEVRATRAWSDEEQTLAAALADRLQARTATATAYDYFDGLVGDLASLVALDADGADAVVDRLIVLAAGDGWTQDVVGPPRFRPAARISDATLGTGSVLLGGLWARRHGVARSDELVEHAAEVLMGEAEDVPAGLRWRFVPMRFRTEEDPTEMPNWSHGQAGIAAALALASAELGRPAWVEAARSGAEHLVSLGDTSDGGLSVPRYVPHRAIDEEPFALGWCHGASGTSLLFAALEHAGVPDVAGATPGEWRGRCLTTVHTSGIPERLRPGFWDNDGRCCGTAGVGDIVLDAWQQHGRRADLDLALRLADALVRNAQVDGPHAWWRFVEHRAASPLLPPGVGWMQGAAGIAAYLFRVDRVLEHGPAAAAVPRLDTWWAGPGARPAP
ncbi:hypothetical protein ASG88_18510 [Nocardioides sp. Soil777]|uniref:lanthionine synthetase LanC family protein n=1 Tax=Nocardioides sp. Soil777 TaxID=1736409 RepID=UPI000702C278|nr:lanthionine synthetase LanC family protein [Nocardioides sp. Soil777]KRF06923.1 hypothetical protein ASG88_18510 [Nocardioides sp. Soil777]